jgi:hypothetical protein
MRSTRSTSSCITVSTYTICFHCCTAYLESPSGLEREWWDLFAPSTRDVDSKHTLSAFVQHLHDGKGVLLQGRIGQLVHSIVGLVASVVDCLRNVLDVFVDLLLVPWSRVGVRANEIDKRLYALDKGCCLILKVVLYALVGCEHWVCLQTYLELKHTAIACAIGTIHADTLAVVPTIWGTVRTVPSGVAAAAFAAATAMMTVC